MKLNSGHWTPLTAGRAVFTATTIAFAILSILNPENWPLKIGTQASLTSLMFLNGLQLISEGKKRSAYAHIGVSIFLLIVMVFTLYVWLMSGGVK